MPFTQLVSLTQMRNTLRRMVGRYSPQQMPDTQLDTYINLAYTLHFPEQFKNLKLTKPYVFTTIPNVDTYPFPYQDGLLTNPDGSNVPGNIQLTPPVYCQGYLLRYYQDKTTFYNRWPKLTVNQQINSGNGTSGPYTGTINPFPFLRAQLDAFGKVTEAAVLISAQDNTGFNYVITDVPSPNTNIGSLIDNVGNLVGRVNYLTGFYDFTVANSQIIPSGDVINASVIPYQPSRPTDVIFYNQQITFRPVPFDIYQVEFQISQQPTQLIAAGDAPELDEWYLFICALAAKLIYTDFPDPEGEGYLQPILDEQRLIAQRRTLRQMSSQRVQTIFSQPTRPLWGYFLGDSYGGQ